MIKRLEIKDVLDSTNYGGTHPVWVVADDGNVYLLKFRAERDALKDISNFNEFLAYCLDKELGLGLCKYELVFIEIKQSDINMFQKSGVKFESLENAKASIGLNIGISKIKNAQEIANVSDVKFPKSLVKNIANLDNILLNSDRNTSNPNILINPKGDEYYVIDFGLSLLSHRVYERLYSGEDTSKIFMAWETMDVTKDRYYIFKNQNKLNFNKNYNTIITMIDGILAQCPREWEVLRYTDEIKKIIAMRILTDTFKGAYPCCDF